MDILIIEDEAYASERLKEMISEVIQDAEVIASLTSVKESIQWLSKNKADLIFLDIQLSDGLSFEIFEYLEINTPVIFTTAYDQYAIKAFELNSIDYLLKPIKKEELRRSFDKLSDIQSIYEPEISSVINSLSLNNKEFKSRFLIKVGEQLRSITTSEIAYFYAMDKAIYLRTFEGKKYSLEQSLDDLESKLDPNMFFRINRAYIVNINSIEAMHAWSRSRVKLELIPGSKQDDTVVSINRTPEFKKWLDS